MPPVPRNQELLAAVSTGYTVFEDDQVLTAGQLNSVADYADDQIRLTRTRLSGVGIACGLRASVSGTSVRVTAGVGVTTDGDLLYLDADTVFDRWREYGRSFPAYPRLYERGDLQRAMYAAYELFPAGAPGSPGRPMSEFAAATGKTLADLSAVLLMESYRQDDDLCSGTDCDNLGARAVNTRKLLLVERAAVGALSGAPATPAQAYALLPELAAERPVLTAAMDTTAELAEAYRSACTSIHNRLAAALPLIHQHAGAFLGGIVTANTAGTWVTKLTGYRTAFATATSGIQYYYDFLKDVVEAYNEFREHLFSDRTWCAPPIATFPKHLLLGELSGSVAARTAWYPSPVTSRAAGELDHARFLLQRLDALINRFAVPTGANQAVTVTPSAAEDRLLGDRAIPFYYTPGGSDPIHRRWSWRLAQRGAEAQAYGYHAGSWAAAGSPAATPLRFQIGRSDFFRVEGVVGKAVGTAMDQLEALIAANNLPFSVRAVLLGTETPKVVRRRGRPVRDLHYVHRVIRRDADRRLRDAETFTRYYSAEVVRATETDEVFDEQEQQQRDEVRSAATARGSAVAGSARMARRKTGGTYASYRPGAQALQDGVHDTIEFAADLSFQVKSVANTGYITPLETLMAGGQTAWLPWLDEILDWRDDQDDKRLLWSAFVREHPQVEHFGGVTRGGTLVLLHDAAGTVVAEVMLPYTWEEEPVEEEKPTLNRPVRKPTRIRRPPVRRVPTRRRDFVREWKAREPELQQVKNARLDVDDWVQTQTKLIQETLADQIRLLAEEKINWQTSLVQKVGETYEKVLETSFAYMPTPSTTYQPGRVTTPGVEQQFEDPTLGLLNEGIRKSRDAIRILEDLARDDPAMEGVLDSARQTASDLLGQAARYIGENEIAVETGTEGGRLLTEMSWGMTLLRGTDQFSLAQGTVQDVAANTSNLSFKELAPAKLNFVLPG